MSGEVANILDGLDQEGLEPSDLAEEGKNASYEEESWVAEINIDELDGEEYVHISYESEGVENESISSLAQNIGNEKVEWGINWSNLLDLSNSEIKITLREDGYSLMGHTDRPSEGEVKSNREVAENLNFENQTEIGSGVRWKRNNCSTPYVSDLYSREDEISFEKFINSLWNQEEAYFIKKGSTVRETAEWNDGETNIRETATMTATIDEENSIYVDVYIPLEGSTSAGSYSELGFSDEYADRCQKIIENLDDYTQAKIDSNSAPDEERQYLPNSELLTEIERHIGQGTKIKVH